MFFRNFYYIVTILVCISLAFPPLVFSSDLSLSAADIVAPKVIHEKIIEPLSPGSTLQIKAKVTDNVGVQSVTLFYHTIGESEYKRIALNPTDVADEYGVTLGQNDLAEPGIEYYLEATDLTGNTKLHGYSFSPFIVKIEPDTAVAAAAHQHGDTGIEATTDTTIITTTATTAVTEETTKKGKSTNKWLWITLGVLAVGALAAAAGNDGGDSGSTSTGNNDGGGDSTLIVTAPGPSN